MNKNIIFGFIGGVVTGAAVTYAVIKKKYQDISIREIQAVIDSYGKNKTCSENMDQISAENETEEEAVEEPVEETETKQQLTEETGAKHMKTAYVNNPNRVRYDKKNKDDHVSIAGHPNKKPKQIPVVEEKTAEECIYVIKPEEFNTLDKFESETLYYSEDHQVIDSDYKILTTPEIEKLIGGDPYGRFGEYEDDSVYIRNEILMIDYEILLSLKTSEEIVGG